MKTKTLNKERVLNYTVYSKCRTVYLILFMAAVFSRVLLPISLYEPQFISTLVFSMVALFGSTLMIIDFFSEKIMFSGKNCVFLIWFLIATTVSCILNARYGIFPNIKNLIWMAISFFVLYPISTKITKKDLYKEIRLLSNILIVVWFVAVLVSLFMFLLEVGQYVIVSPEIFFRIGFIESRLFGIFEDPNFAATTSIIVFMFSFWNITALKNKKLKIFYIINIILQFFYIVLSGSRTAELCLLLIMFLFSYFYARKKFNKNTLNKFLKETILIICSALLCGAMVVFMQGTKFCLSYLPPLVSSQISTSQSTESKIKPITTKREDIADGSDITSCRVKIWKSAIELFKSRPIFGTSPRNLRSFAKANFPNGFIAKRDYAVHNIYLDVLTSTGIVGAIFFALFLIKTFFQILKYLFLKQKSQNYFIVLFCFCITANTALSAMFLTDILFVNTIGVLFFWLCLGYAMHFIKTDKS